jgi:hypothetical protein
MGPTLARGLTRQSLPPTVALSAMSLRLAFTDFWPSFQPVFGRDHLRHERHHRLPLRVAHVDLHPARVPQDPERVLAEETACAAMVVSGPTGSVRNRLQRLLDAYKPVASGGKFRNNVPTSLLVHQPREGLLRVWRR